MGRIGRLAGAILTRSEERWFLVGEPKVPLDLAAHGFREVGRFPHQGHEIVELARDEPARTRRPEAGEPPVAGERGAAPQERRPGSAGPERRPLLSGGHPARPPLEEPALPFVMPLEGEALARRLHDIFVITRNNSVSERLFRFLDGTQRGSPDLTWLALAPPEAITLIRDGLLRCS